MNFIRAPHFRSSLVSLVCSLTVATSALSQNLQQIKNSLGWADRWGNLSIWFDFDEDMKIGGPDEAAKLPVRLQFCSEQRFVGQGIGGEGWWCPLLESRVKKLNENSVRLYTLSGNSETLYQDAKDSSLYATKDQQWKGRIKASHFEVTDDAGWTYDYSDGRLLAALTHKGDVLRWSYEGTKATAIESKQFGRLLSASYDPKTGMISRIDYNKDAYLSFKVGTKPLVTTAPGGTSVISTATSIIGMTNKAGYVMDGAWERDSKTKMMKLILTEKDGAKPQTSRTFQWDPATGWLKHDGDFDYTVIPSNNSKDAFPALERENARGQKESYKYDTQKMEAVHVKLDGSTTTYQYLSTRGPAFGKLMKTVQTMPNGNVKTTYEATFDASGKIAKVFTGGSNIQTLRVNSWDPAEAVPLIAQFQTPDREDLNIAGPKNLLVGAVIGGRPYVYLHDDKGTMTGRLHLSEFLKKNRKIKLPANPPQWLLLALKEPNRQ